jgi:hypothetical protein
MPTNSWDKKKVGRKPKGYKPPYIQTLQIRREKITLIFDTEVTQGSFTDLFNHP